ncbi:hypothetical protein A3C26_01035 [Candidatus Daviesbacteria bacterium RIFCSPHIGHO2_02_FULL_39_12]|uniref:Glycosyltransferase RgtA/B/C/D-like domain-containing protein n=2 Tax=Candidatus Daviesiibacteriota TaxID=1752718 RepID=A0A1F5JDR8_9BACT|nr:MAG: hypothetical protein A3C26_01035 [Candidatus Daviesbacteria bacterium RIFCSPHIGHO2_02_FULL_39_12]OGE72636.1 MAG: hypothetical protein A3H40_01105 [Candidatus Daviesbacteria bacterium RIFCSPLOWO2_02_FULL_38_15]
MNNNRIVSILILLGLAIRLLFLPLPGFNIDVNDWFAWATRLSHFDFSHFYSKDIFSDYTPGYLYILSVLGFLKNLLRVTDSYFYLLLKIPAIVSELVIGLILYKESKKYVSEKLALLASAFILLTPALIFNSAVWGQIDSISALLMLSAIIHLKNKNLIISSIFFGLALLVKPQTLALLPLFAIFLINHFKALHLFKLTMPGLLIIFIIAFPFFPNQTLANLAQQIINTANEYPYNSINAYNLWGVAGFWINDNQIWNNLSYQTWGYILLAGYWMVIVYFYFRKKLSIYTIATLATLGFFFLPTRVHERYLYPAIIFLVLTTAMLKSKLLLVLTGMLSFLHFLNLYYVYVYYNEIYLKLPKILYNPVIYNFLDTHSKELSLTSIIIFILISATIIKYGARISKTG